MKLAGTCQLAPDDAFIIRIRSCLLMSILVDILISPGSSLDDILTVMSSNTSEKS